MPLIYCPVCESPASDQAPYCPKCGHPLAVSPSRRLSDGTATEGSSETAEPQSAPRSQSAREVRSDVELIQEAFRRQQQRPQVVVRPAPLVQTIERTGKKWKALMLIGALMFIGGTGTCMVGMSAEAQSQSSLLAGLGVIGFLVAALGLSTFVVGRICGWWYHG